MGLGAAWLANNGQANHDEHMIVRPNRVQRSIARVGLRTRYGALFTALEAMERPRRDGEASEPSDII